jgi:hypothetical protein
MLEAEARALITTAAPRREIELSARMILATAVPREARLDGRAAEARALAWADARAAIFEAAGRHAGAGLKVLRAEKTRPGVILRGPVAAWRAFIDGEKALVRDPALEFRLYQRPWTHGLPGTPE